MKRHLLIALAVLVTGLWMMPALAAEQEITSIEQAQELAKKAKKDILVDFSGSDWCGWCIKLDEVSIYLAGDRDKVTKALRLKEDKLFRTYFPGTITGI